MIGLIVQFTQDYARIWSTSLRRFINYSTQELPQDSVEGDWLNIEFDQEGILQGIHKRRNMLETRWKDNGELQVLDIFLFIPNRDETFSDYFGVVKLETGRNVEWAHEMDTRDHTFQLWMTISSNAKFFIEEQSLDRAYSKEGKYSDTYFKLNKLAQELQLINGIHVKSSEILREKVMLVGFAEKSQCFYAISHGGESLVHSSEWSKIDNVQLGDVFDAILRLHNDTNSDAKYRVEKLERRADLWEGVQLNVSDGSVRVELRGQIVERRPSCFALDTVPFGLITYPLNLGLPAIPDDVQIGDYLRVRINRFKSSEADYPSKFQVTCLLERLPSHEKKERDWVEGLVTYITGNHIMISFEHGNSVIPRNRNINLSLGTVVDMCVRDTGDDNHFELIDINTKTRRRTDIVVERTVEGGKELVTVFCAAEVIERRDKYFLLRVPIMGLAIFFFKSCPQNMKVGDVWDVKMHRRKELRDDPSHWVVHGVTSKSPRSNTSSINHLKIEDIVPEERKKDTIPSNRSDDNQQWTTVMITGRNNGHWYSSCAKADTVGIPKALVEKMEFPGKGKFYRLKCSKQNRNLWWATELDPEPIQMEGFELVMKADGKGLRVWCYAVIDSCHKAEFTLFNEVLGQATLPHKFAYNDMRVGDEVEAMYYRVKDSKNPTHWMVTELGKLRKRSDRYQDQVGRNDRSEDWRHEENSHEYDEGPKLSKDEERSEVKQKKTVTFNEDAITTHHYEENKDRRVTDMMHKYLNDPKLRAIFMKSNPEELKRIEELLKKDLLKP